MQETESHQDAGGAGYFGRISPSPPSGTRWGSPSKVEEKSQPLVAGPRGNGRMLGHRAPGGKLLRRAQSPRRRPLSSRAHERTLSTRAGLPGSSLRRRTERLTRRVHPSSRRPWRRRKLRGAFGGSLGDVVEQRPGPRVGLCRAPLPPRRQRLPCCRV